MQCPGHAEDVSFSTTQVLMVASAPLLMVAVSLFERRWGPKVAGMVAAAPITAFVGLLLVRFDIGEGSSHDMAMRMSGYIPAQLGIAVILAALVGRVGMFRSLVGGTMTYACLAWIAALLPTQVAIVASLFLLAAGRLLVTAPDAPDVTDRPAVIGRSRMIALRAGVSLITAIGLLLIAHQFGPSAGGAVGAFPIFTVTLCMFIYANAGQLGVRQALGGMVQSLPAYFGFVLTYGITTPRLGTVGGSVASTVVCTSCYLLLHKESSAHAHRDMSTHPQPEPDAQQASAITVTESRG